MLSIRSASSPPFDEKPTQSPHATLDAIVHGGGAMGERIRAFDWSRHPLGPPDTWPQSLRIALRIMLPSRCAMWLGWGPDFHFFCNDAYLPTVGIKENWVLGAPARKVWEEIWDAIGSRAESVMRTGNATWDESLRLLLERSGCREETYHTGSCSPVPDDDGSIGGILCAIAEETERVIGDRRLALLRELAADAATTNTEAGLFEATGRRLAARPHDVPFALVYLFESHATEARLVASHGVSAGHPIAPALIRCNAASPEWPARAILEHRATDMPPAISDPAGRGGQSPSIIVDDLAARFQEVPAGPWDKPPRQAIVVPIAQQGARQPAGFIVAGINPFRPFDTAYAGFVDLLAGQIAAGLSNVRAYESERTRSEALAELDRAKTTFFNNVSHELRTPLTLMLAPIEDILKHPAASGGPPGSASVPPASPGAQGGGPRFQDNAALREIHELASVAHRNGLRLLKLVNTVLDFSSLEAGRMHATFEPTDLATLTGELATSFRSTIERGGVQFAVDCPPLSEPVHVDRDMWEKIVLNLISNAFKFTLQGEIRVSLRLVGECVEFAVQDTGAGIPPEARPHLFERFYRVRGTQSRTLEGTGIGLALVHELVKLHGGTLHLESEPGVGSTFTVFLRLGCDHLPKENVPQIAGSSSTAVNEESFVEEARQWDPISGDVLPLDDEFALPGDITGKVLVVDDNADMRRYIARLLSSRFRVITAADGGTALELVQLENPDLVLTDVMMPKLDGFGLLRAIRSRPALRTIPVILLSARAGEAARVEGLDAGADDFLVKPFSARELLARVSVHLQMARIRGQAEERERELRTSAETFAQALRESTERLSASLVAAGTGTFRWDIRTNALDSDEALDRLFGLAPGKGVRTLADFVQAVHPDDRARMMAASQRCTQEGADFDMEFRVILPDGSVRWLDDKARTFFDPGGKPEYMTGACVDITRRKQIEAFVWRQRDVLEQIVQGAPISDVLETLTLDVEQVAQRRLIATVLLVEPDGRRLRTVAGQRCPAAWARAVDGLEIGPMAGSCGTAAFRKERVIVRDVNASPLWENYRTEAVKHGLRACWSTPILSSDGTVLGTFAIYYPQAAAPTEEELRYVDIVSRTAAIVIERDRSQRALKASKAQLEEYAQSLERRVTERTAKLQETVSELESFSYSISHDMRAPLRAMQSFAQILAEDCSDQIGPEGKDYIRRIIGASDRMDCLIQDVLTYSRVTRTELKLEPVDLEKLIDGILESYPQFQPPHAQIEVKRPMPRVLGNEAALTQCFSNLIGNAIKFVATDRVPRVEIWTETHEARVRVSVRDNGIGIEPGAHEKIFRIFYQLNRNYDGTGIGLSVVRKAAERMGGRVGLESEPGRGSTFHLELTLAPDQ